MPPFSRTLISKSKKWDAVHVVIWPDINVGNIGVKIIQNLTGANAYGPMLQGFKKIVCDCSRSAPVDEIVGNVVMSCVRAQALKEA